MEIKRVVSPFILAGLFAGFAVVCFLVWLKKGKQEKLISRKMKLGAAIIAITGITTGCPPVVTCYEPVPENRFSFDSIDNTSYAVVADLPNDSVLTGKVYDPTFERYIFKIETRDSLLVDEGNIEAVNGLFDESVEDFKLTINSMLDTGSYRLFIFPKERDQQEVDFEIFQTELKIK